MGQESLLDSSRLPSWKDLASYIFFIATGQEFDPAETDRSTGFVGRNASHYVFLSYEPDVDRLKSLSLSLAEARAGRDGDCGGPRRGSRASRSRSPRPGHSPTDTGGSSSRQPSTWIVNSFTSTGSTSSSFQHGGKAPPGRRIRPVSRPLSPPSSSRRREGGPDRAVPTEAESPASRSWDAVLSAPRPSTPDRPAAWLS